ncbi:MAG: tetratricopeptide repeat protein [Acidobacteriota bacterium]|nr:tetratricopeptide repeat protein [Acidobacteriota bacterium]
MSQSRIDAFKAMVKDLPDNDPNGVMIWYGLANEYTKLEQWPEAVEALRHVIRINPDYTAAYQMLGSALINTSARQEARHIWTQGIEAANRTGAWKARQHMEGLLAGTEDNPETGFCKE